MLSSLPSSSEAWKPSEGSQLQKQRKQEETGQDRTQETEIPLLPEQLDLDEDSVSPKYNGIELGEREVPRGGNIAVPN